MNIATSILERIALPWGIRSQWEITRGNYQVRLVQNAVELDAALRLRFEVFNLELGEGLATSYLTGRDQDPFDAVCQHLIAIDLRSGAIVGTYRLQTLATARDAEGFYTSGEFDLRTLPRDVLHASVEIGRACIAMEHRSTQVLLLLWQGLMRFLTIEDKRYFFGCCSLTSQDGYEGMRIFQSLQDHQQLHPAFRVSPKPGFECHIDDSYRDGDQAEPKLPKLFRAYLRFGALVCGPPAIDRQFRTIDYFVICDTAQLTAEKRQMLLAA